MLIIWIIQLNVLYCGIIKNITIKNTENMEALKQKLQDLQEALAEGSISVNEYSSMYHATYQQIKKLQNT